MRILICLMAFHLMAVTAPNIMFLHGSIPIPGREQAGGKELSIQASLFCLGGQSLPGHFQHMSLTSAWPDEVT